MNTTTKAPAAAIDLTNQLRATDGKFGHGFDRVCKCGRRKGDHSAARPFGIDEGDHQCDAFKAAKR